MPPIEEDARETGLRRYIHDLYRDFQPVQPAKLTEAERERLQHARIHLADVTNMSSGLGSIYRPIIARTLFCLGEFGLAAAGYESLYQSDARFMHRDELVTGGFLEREEDYQWETSFMAALCHKLDGNFDKAMLVFERLRSSDHDAQGAAWWAARWYMERGDYTKAAELLEQELTLRFSPVDSWELSTILALGKVLELQQDPFEFVRRLHHDLPELESLLFGTCVQLWPNFTRLSSGSLDHWLHAIFERKYALYAQSWRMEGSGGKRRDNFAVPTSASRSPVSSSGTSG